MAKRVGKGVREKLRRAHMHREDFQRRLERFTYSGAYKVFPQDDVEAGERRWIVRVYREPPLIRWGALIGECLFNFRSALDHLAYDLAVAHSGAPLAPKVEEQSEFPIFWQRAPTTRELDRRIGAVHPKARKLIETMQPYGRKDRAALKYLDALHNFDKHRTLHLVSGTNAATAYFGDMPFIHINFSPFVDGDVLAITPLPDEGESNKNLNFLFRVAFDEAGPGGKAPDVEATLGWIGEHIEGQIIAPLLPYL